MRAPLALSLFLFPLLTTHSLAATTPAIPASPICDSNAPPPPAAISAGLALQVILPNFSDFPGSMTSYGPMVSFPIGRHSVRIITNFGSNDVATAYLVEAAFLYNLNTPFLPWVVMGGAHYLRYRAAQVDHDVVGLNFGPGLKFLMGKTMDLELAMKVYFQQVYMTGFSGCLSLRL